MSLDANFSLSSSKVARELQIAGRTNREERNSDNFLIEMGKRAPVDTGFMPSGLKSYAQSGNYAQMVIECVPDINLISWGETENDPNVQRFMLAQPWRLIIADLIDGSLFGARMFYSPIPFNSPDQPLYHANLPNLNCLGYGRSNAVGWLCLYRNESWLNLSIAARMQGIIERCSGMEAFNNRNMNETDGPRLYSSKGYPEYTWNPVYWEKKTEEEGIDWTLKDDTWIPVLVSGRDDQSRHNNSGIPLTIDMAMNGHYDAYYDDNYHPKPSLALRDGQYPPNFFGSIIKEAFYRCAERPPSIIGGHLTVNPAILAKQLENEEMCVDCKETLETHDGVYYEGDSFYCNDCIFFNVCEACNVGINPNYLYVDFETEYSYCKSCTFQNEDINILSCELCIIPLSESGKMDKEDTYLCVSCYDNHDVCDNCSAFEEIDSIITLDGLNMYCRSCVITCDKCKSTKVNLEKCNDPWLCSSCVAELNEDEPIDLTEETKVNTNE